MPPVISSILPLWRIGLFKSINSSFNLAIKHFLARLGDILVAIWFAVTPFSNSLTDKSGKVILKIKALER